MGFEPETPEYTDAVTVRDGKLVVDMAKANELWDSFDVMKRAEFTTIIFEPVLRQATKTKAALGQLLEQVYQMEGMFPGDEALQAAIKDAEEALNT